MPYQHVLVVCDGSNEADEAVRAASARALADRARLLTRDQAPVVRRRTNCAVLQPR